MTMLPSGVLDRRLVIEQPVTTRASDTGAEVITWQTLATVWAELVESEAGQSATTGEDASVVTAARHSRVRMRYRSDVNESMRFRVGGRVLQILGMAEIGRREGLKFSCKAWSHE